MKNTEPVGFDPCDFKEYWLRDCDNIKYFQNEIER
jgi:hypothetical protein